MSVDPRWEKVQRVHQAVSASAGDLVPALAEIIEDGAWREFVHPMDGLKRYERFAEFCSDTLRITADAVEALLDRSSLKSTAEKVRRLLREDIQPIRRNGGLTKDELENGCNNMTPIARGDSQEYAIARLKRDNPDLAQRVIDGELSAHAAALQAGIKRPRAQILVDDPHDAIRGLLKFFTVEQLEASLMSITADTSMPTKVK